MVEIALGLGVYAYLILAVGLLGLLYPLPVGLITLIFGIILGLWLRTKSLKPLRQFVKEVRLDKVALLAFAIITFQALINFFGAISPELSFDALWYHLTSAKLYVQNHRIFYFEGWLLWPANMPRLADMFYVAALLLSNEVLAKLIHFSFGLLSSVALFNLLRRYFNLRISLLGVMTFYTMLIVGWQSTTAYVDLARTFFEILALDFFLKWVESKEDNNLLDSAVLTGLAISTKIFALGTLLSFVALIILLRRKKWFFQGTKFLVFSLLMASPWLILSYLHTGNPLFPLFGAQKEVNTFSQIPDISWPIKNLLQLPLFLWQATFNSDTFISPVYLIFFPVILVLLLRRQMADRVVAAYLFICIVLSPKDTNRYLLPYLPALTILAMLAFKYVTERSKFIFKFIIFMVFSSAVLNLGSRVIATEKFLPYLTRQESKAQFLKNNLNFNFGDFYDVDGYFARNIHKDDLVLIYDIHNLYYVNFPFIHESMAKEGTFFTHILVGNGKDLPRRYGERLLLYENPQTRVKLYLFGEKY